MNKNSILARGIGRRKEAIAQVCIIEGTGQFLINDFPAHLYLQQNPRSITAIGGVIKKLTADFSKVQDESTFSAFDTVVKVKGGGLVGQADAIKLGLARAMLNIKEEYRKSLKEDGFLTQDSRVKERRKYGLKKARKASQYHKR